MPTTGDRIATEEAADYWGSCGGNHIHPDGFLPRTAVQAANKELKARSRAVTDCRRPLGRNAPDTLQAAEAALLSLRDSAHEAAAQQPQVPPARCR